MIKKKIAYLLVKIAKLLYPVQRTVFEQEGLYKPMVCGKAFSISKKVIRSYNTDHGLKSLREAKRKVVSETIAQAKEDVLKSIESNVMEQRVYEKDGETIVEVRVSCYVEQKKD